MLLELVAVNEAADREGELIRRAEGEELRRLEESHPSEGGGVCWGVLEAVEAGLDERGRWAVDELAEASVLLGTISSDPVVMGERIIELGHEKFEMEEQLRRINDLRNQLEREMVTMQTSIDEIQSQVDEVAQEDMQQQTAQLNRETKQFTTKMGQYTERAATLEKFTINSPSIPDVK